MVGKKIDRKQLKQPDEFITLSAKILEWGQTNSRQISMGIIAVAVIVCAVAGYRFFDSRAETKAFAMLYQADRAYDNSLQKAAANNPVDDKIISAYQEIVDKYPTKSAGRIARKTLADIHFDAGQYDQATRLFEHSLKDFEKDQFYRSMLLNDLALAHEANTNGQEAQKYFELITEQPDAPVVDQALFHLAGWYEKKGEPEKARELYGRIVSEQAGSIYSNVVKELKEM